MIWGRAIINARKFVMLMTVEMLLAVTITAQQKSESIKWQTYSPSRASFSIQVPGDPLPAQGHIFDGDNEWAYRLIEYSSHSRTYNFEVKKSGKRSFLVSILEVQTLKRRPHRFITDSEVDAINAVIADGIMHSKVVRLATDNGEISQWSYKRKAGLGDDDKDDGIVYVRRRDTCMVIIVVDYDYAKPGDVDVKAMLDSLRVR